MKYTKHLIAIFTFLFTTILLGQELIKNGSFEDGLKNWTLKGNGAIDNLNSSLGKNSLKISLSKPAWQRIFQTIKVNPSSQYTLEYYVKCQDIVPKVGAKFSGVASQILMKKYFPLTGSAGPWKLDKGNSSWQKVSYNFTTSKDDKNISIQFMLYNASGSMWIDNVSLKENKTQTNAITLNLYPIKFLGKTPYQIAQNLTGTIYFSAQSKLKVNKQDKIEMIVDVPNFITLAGAAPKFAMEIEKNNSQRIHRAYKIKETKIIKRKNQSYKRYQITFTEDLKRYFASSWFTHYLFLKANKDSVNKKGNIYCYINTGNKVSNEVIAPIEVIPAIIKKNPPTKHFEMMFGKLPFLSIKDNLPGQEENRTFWSSLSKKRYTWVRPCDQTVKGFEPIITVGNNFWTVIASAKKDLATLKKTLPANISDKGTKRPGFAVWSKLDLENPRIIKMYQNGAKEIQRLFPETKNVVWDFEPHPYGFDLKGRERFAKTMKLPFTPSIEQLTSQYRTIWFNYMVKLHAQYINRFVKTFKASAPNINFNLCSDNLYAGENTISAWCGVDVRLSDSVVDGHMHMPYYTGKKFFDDCQFNIKNLKKPFFPLIDPAEALYSFYKQYDANKIKQNIIAIAALGGKGIGFWPSDAFSANYTKAIAQAYDIIYDVENFYHKGKRCDELFKFTPVNAISKTIIKNNKKITLNFPDFISSFRKTVHQYNNRILFTLFNYHPTEEAIIKISGMGKEKLVAIKANGVKVVFLDSPQDKSVLNKVKDFKTKSANLKLTELKKGNISLEWTAKDNGAPYFQLKNNSTTLGVDVFKEGNIISFTSENGSQFISNGFLGKIMFKDNLQQEIPFKIDSIKITSSGPQVSLKGIVGPYAGAMPIANPLLDMVVYKKYTLSKNTLNMELTFYNPTNKNMTFAYRLNNFPYPGKRFDAKEIVTYVKSNNKMVKLTSTQNTFTINGKESLFTKNKPLPWNYSNIISKAKNGTLEDVITITPDSKFIGITSWFDIYNHTIELLTNNITIKPKQKISFKCNITISSK